MAEVRVLLVDDDEWVTGIMRRYLEAEGFTVDIAPDGAEALRLVEERDPQVVVLDLMLPKIEGLEVCRRIRLTRQTPIIILTALGQVEDRVRGLDLGADDYLTKPFSTRELISRIRAVLRRSYSSGTGTPDPTLSFPGLTINPARREVLLAGKPVALTPKELDLLVFLARNQGYVFSRESLLDKVWGYDFCGEPRTVDALIKRLRQKVEPPGHPYTYLQTVWGAGYKFEVMRGEE